MAPESLPGTLHLLDRCLYLERADALVLADVPPRPRIHSAVDAPIDDVDAPHERLERALEQVKPSTVVVAGDLLHSFSTVPLSVARQLEQFTDTVAAADATLILVEGNHDTVLSRVYDGAIESHCHLAAANAVIAHGHEHPDQTAELLIVGHGHPAMVVDGRKYPCFLYGPRQYEGHGRAVLPTFTRLARGVRINGARRSLDSPLVTDLGACRFQPSSIRTRRSYSGFPASGAVGGSPNRRSIEYRRRHRGGCRFHRRPKGSPRW
ncbi:MAG: metallophosphoesterase [Natrialbaceae archaeon]|nr:metallophosphoesterase [Natrialbaceae archaeon]